MASLESDLKSVEARKAGEATLERYLPSIHKRWKAGCRNGMQWWQKCMTLDQLLHVRPILHPCVAADGFIHKEDACLKARRERLLIRRLIWLVLVRLEQLTPEQTQEIACASSLHPDVALAFKLALTIAKMLRERAVSALPVWLALAQDSSISSTAQLAQGIERDRAVVEAALSRPESNGQTEGKVNKLKGSKRQMYGRAKFDLLCQRMLLCG